MKTSKSTKGGGSTKNLKQLMKADPLFTPEGEQTVSPSGSTITKDHYTSKGEHPEDRIYRDREYIHRLRAHLDEVYDTLEKDLGVLEGDNWLFDFVHNEDRCIEFEDYLSEQGVLYKNIVAQKRRGKRRAVGG